MTGFTFVRSDGLTMVSSRSVRAVAVVVAATLLAVVIGTARAGSVGGGLALGVAVGVGVAAGLVGFELLNRYRRP